MLKKGSKFIWKHRDRVHTMIVLEISFAPNALEFVIKSKAIERDVFAGTKKVFKGSEFKRLFSENKINLAIEL